MSNTSTPSNPINLPHKMAFGNSTNSNTNSRIQWDSEAVCERHGNHTNGECRAQNNPNAKCVLHGGHSNRDCRSQVSRAPPVRFPAAAAPRGSYLAQAPRPPQPPNVNAAWGLAASRLAQEAEKNRIVNIQYLEQLRLEREEGGGAAAAVVQPVRGEKENGGYRFKETFKYTGAKRGVVGGGMEQGNKVEEAPAPRRTAVPPHVAHAERLRVAKLREQQGGGGEKKGGEGK